MLHYIEMLELESHEEGGYFSLYYKSPNKIIPLNSRYKNNADEYVERNICSSIYFLLEKQAFSAWHRLKSDEIWHYYDGQSPLDIYVIDKKGKLKIYTLGNPEISENASFQIIVQAGVWFAAEVRDKLSFALVGCSVSPAFEYQDFELAEKYREQWVKQQPELTNIIDKFIKPNILQSDNNNIYNQNVVQQKKIFSAKDYIRKFKLGRNQEGGYFCLNYKSKDLIAILDSKKENNETENQQRCAGTAMYFLLDKQDFSAWHRLKSDEIWHYYTGDSPIDIHIINQNGDLKTFTLGNPNITKGASFQIAIQAGDWIAAEVKNKLYFALIGRITSPGLEYGDAEIANRKILIAKYPQHKSIINRLTRITPSSSKLLSSKAAILA